MAEPPVQSPGAAPEPVSGPVPDALGVVGELLVADSAWQGILAWLGLLAGGQTQVVRQLCEDFVAMVLVLMDASLILQ